MLYNIIYNILFTTFPISLKRRAKNNNMSNNNTYNPYYTNKNLLKSVLSSQPNINELYLLREYDINELPYLLRLMYKSKDEYTKSVMRKSIVSGLYVTNIAMDHYNKYHRNISKSYSTYEMNVYVPNSALDDLNKHVTDCTNNIENTFKQKLHILYNISEFYNYSDDIIDNYEYDEDNITENKSILNFIIKKYWNSVYNNVYNTNEDTRNITKRKTAEESDVFNHDNQSSNKVRVCNDHHNKQLLNTINQYNNLANANRISFDNKMNVDCLSIKSSKHNENKYLQYSFNNLYFGYVNILMELYDCYRFFITINETGDKVGLFSTFTGERSLIENRNYINVHTSNVIGNNYNINCQSCVSQNCIENVEDKGNCHINDDIHIDDNIKYASNDTENTNDMKDDLIHSVYHNNANNIKEDTNILSHNNTNDMKDNTDANEHKQNNTKTTQKHIDSLNNDADDLQMKEALRYSSYNTVYYNLSKYKEYSHIFVHDVNPYIELALLHKIPVKTFNDELLLSKPIYINENLDYFVTHKMKHLSEKRTHEELYKYYLFVSAIMGCLNDGNNSNVYNYVDDVLYHYHTKRLLIEKVKKKMNRNLFVNECNGFLSTVHNMYIRKTVSEDKNVSKVYENKNNIMNDCLKSFILSHEQLFDPNWSYGTKVLVMDKAYDMYRSIYVNDACIGYYDVDGLYDSNNKRTNEYPDTLNDIDMGNVPTYLFSYSQSGECNYIFVDGECKINKLNELVNTNTDRICSIFNSRDNKLRRISHNNLMDINNYSGDSEYNYCNGINISYNDNNINYNNINVNNDNNISYNDKDNDNNINGNNISYDDNIYLINDSMIDNCNNNNTSKCNHNSNNYNDSNAICQNTKGNKCIIKHYILFNSLPDNERDHVILYRKGLATPIVNDTAMHIIKHNIISNYLDDIFSVSNNLSRELYLIPCPTLQYNNQMMSICKLKEALLMEDNTNVTDIMLYNKILSDCNKADKYLMRDSTRLRVVNHSKMLTDYIKFLMSL